MKLFKNPDKCLLDEIQKQLTENDGYCPCRVTKNADTKCICKNFKESIKKQKETKSETPIECDCGLWIYG